MIKKISKILFVLMIFLCLIACKSVNLDKKTYSFEINKKDLSHKIINYDNKFGDGTVNGCIIQNQFKVIANYNRDNKILNGIITDFKYKNTVYTSIFINNKEITHTDENGNFQIKIDEKTKYIKLISLGYLDFEIDLKSIELDKL